MRPAAIIAPFSPGAGDEAGQACPFMDLKAWAVAHLNSLVDGFIEGRCT
jgi:hypothetical protein